MRTYLRFIQPVLGVFALAMCVRCWWQLQMPDKSEMPLDGDLQGFGGYTLAIGLFGFSALLILGSLASAFVSKRARIMEVLQCAEEKHDGEGTGQNGEPKPQTEPPARP